MWSTLNFHSRLLLLFVALLVLALFSASAAMFFAAKRTTLGLAEQQLWVTDRLVQKTLESTDRQLRETTGALAADFGFREAVASKDRPTIISALDNQGARINADVAVLMDGNGVVTAATGGSVESLPPQLLLEALNQARAHNPLPAILHDGGGLLQVAIVPVRAPNTIGWVAMGFLIRDSIVQQIKETGGVDISLLVPSEGSGMRVAASTLPAASRTALVAGGGALVKRSRDTHSLHLSGDDYLTVVATGVSSVNDAFSVVLQMPMTVVGEPLSALRRELLMSGGIITIACLIAALLSARMLAQPVRALADAARSLTMSKRRSGAKVGKSDDELANLAEAFHALVRRAHYDGLTGLPNRTLLKDRMDESMERMKREKLPMAVVFIDLNGFKKINDTLGHEMGDLVLRKTAQRLSRSLAPPNIVARLGGDEFVLILEGANESAALKIMDHLGTVVSTPMKSPSGPIKVGMSAGIAIYPSLSLDRETLLKQADAAMYQSKTRKRGPVVAKPANPCKHEDARVEPPPVQTVEERPEDSTWSGHWQGKDLATQNTRILQPAMADQPMGRTPGIPLTEEERLKALRGLKLLDTAPSAVFDRVTRLAAKALDVPIALISLVDERRQWFLSRVGMTAQESPREVSFCAHAVYDGKPLVVPDAADDARFANNPLVADEPRIRAYLGIPVFTRDGHAVGTLCVIDRRARSFTDKDVNTLRDLASIVEELVQARERAVAQRRNAKQAKVTA